mgnify:FL=1
MNTQELLLECMNDVPKEIDIEVNLSFDISSRIDALLSERNLSQKEFAEMIGKRESEVSKWLKGTHNFTLRTLAKISAVLDAPIIQVVSKQNDTYVHHRYGVSLNLFIETTSQSSYAINNRQYNTYTNYPSISQSIN